jgi:hypothetical protein
MYKKIVSSFAILSFLVFSSFTFTATNEYSLNQAMTQQIISASFLHNPNSVHYEKPIMAQLQNESNKTVTIRIPAGLVFTADDDGDQNIVVMQDMMATLSPHQKKTLPLSGNCMEASDNAGDEGSTYSLKGKADANLYKTVQYLKTNKICPSLGQKAIWCITDGEDLESIFDMDNDKAEDLRGYVSELTGQPLPNPEVFDSYAYDYDAEPVIKVQGAVNLEFSYKTEVQVALFNDAGTLVRELFRFENLEPGPHRLPYKFDNSVYTDKRYTIKIIEKGEVLLQQEVKLG